jgi:hypothetical protein
MRERRYRDILTRTASPIPRAGDLLGAVAQRTEDLIGLRMRRPPKNARPKNGVTYSHTISPSRVTSKKRPKEDS